MRHSQNRVRRLLAVLALYLSISGLVTFSMFILEEGIQCCQFGTWPAADAKDWPTVKAGADLMEKINHTLKLVNYTAGWLQPLAFIAYRAYSRAAESYITSIRAKTFAYAPELFHGERLTIRFVPLTKQAAITPGFKRYFNRNITLLTTRELPLGAPATVSVLVQVAGPKVVLLAD